ncbi:MAG: zinc-dependent alcohol dehydrogenase family protein [Anaerolinea sp.]
MRAMQITRITSVLDDPEPLHLATDVPIPPCQNDEVLIQVSACGVCHTEIDEIEGRTPPKQFPMSPGHQVVGRVIEVGIPANEPLLGRRVGVAWIFSSCGSCEYCLTGRENLCPQFRATGRDAHGGYAEYMTAPAAFVYPIPDNVEDIYAAPLLCAGAIGYRSLWLSGIQNQQNLGLVGFGASAHLVLKLVRFLYPDSRVFVFSRTPAEREFARELGAQWAGGIEETPPEHLHAIIDTTPVWTPPVQSLKHLLPGGRLVINAIRKEHADLSIWLSLEYERDLWMEKEIKSVANVTRNDVSEFLKLASQIPIIPEVEVFSLEEANLALKTLKQRKIRGAKVLKIL